MTKTNENQMTAVLLLKDNIVYEMDGWENELQDGIITEDEFFDKMNLDNINALAKQLLNEAMAEGFLESKQSGLILEAKHLKFLGRETLDDIESDAVTLASLTK